MNKYNAEKIEELKDTSAEALVVSNIIKNPGLIFEAGGLSYKHFSDPVNRSIYWALDKIYSSGNHDGKPVCAEDIYSAINGTIGKGEHIPEVEIGVLQEMFMLTEEVPSITLEAFKIAKSTIQDYALRRNTYKALKHCESNCFNLDTSNILGVVYDNLETVNKEFAYTKELIEFNVKVSSLQEELRKRHNGEIKAIDLQFPTLSKYVKLENKELVVIGAEQKVGKSAFLLSATVELLKKGYRILVIDSELSDRLYYMRMLAYISKVEFNKITSGVMSDEERARMVAANQQMKEFNFYHEYIPIFNDMELMMLVKRCNAIEKIDLLVIDYFKSSAKGDAYSVSRAMGRTVDMVKNDICGTLDIPAIGAVQLNKDGSVALSAEVGRNASTLITLERKSKDEIMADGEECGNTKMRVSLNRNGSPCDGDDWIDIQFDGDILCYSEAKKQHAVVPYDGIEAMPY